MVSIIIIHYCETSPKMKAIHILHSNLFTVCSLQTMMYLIVQLFYHLATAIFVLLVFGCSYWLLFFKVSDHMILNISRLDREIEF